MSILSERQYYQNVCIFDVNKRCPLSPLKIKIDGALCQACVDFAAVKGLKTGVITQLLIAFHKEEEAKKMYEEIKKCVREW